MPLAGPAEGQSSAVNQFKSWPGRLLINGMDCLQLLADACIQFVW